MPYLKIVTFDSLSSLIDRVSSVFLNCGPALLIALVAHQKGNLTRIPFVYIGISEILKKSMTKLKWLKDKRQIEDEYQEH